MILVFILLNIYVKIFQEVGVMEKTIRLKRNNWIDPNTNLSFAKHVINTPTRVHLHEFYEMELVVEGEGSQNLNGTLYPLSAGNFYLLTPIDFHSVIPRGSLTLLNISFDGSAISPDMRLKLMNRRDNLFFFDSKHISAIEFFMCRIGDECKCIDEYSAAARESLMRLLFIELFRSGESLSESVPAHTVMPAMQYLFQNFRSDITLGETAAQSGYTASYFSRIFHQMTGIRFVDFLSRLRINYAAMLLVSSSCTVTQAAISSGFSSMSNFFRAFKNETGMSPLEYRRKNTI